MTWINFVISVNMLLLCSFEVMGECNTEEISQKVIELLFLAFSY